MSVRVIAACRDMPPGMSVEVRKQTHWRLKLTGMSTTSSQKSLGVPDVFAHVISYVVSPILAPAATCTIVVLLIGANARQALTALIFIGFVFSVVPLVDILWMVARGSAHSLDLPERNQRTEPLSLVIVTGLVGLSFYSRSESVIDLVAVLALTYVANLALVLVINLFWKISVHAIAVGGMLGVVLYLVGPASGLTPPFEAWLIASLMALVPMVMWARIRLRMHTPAQVIAGAALGLVGHWAGLYIMTKVWF